MHLVATIISTRHLGFCIDIVTDGTMYVGAFSTRFGGGDFIRGTGSRSIEETLAAVEECLGALKPKAVSRRRDSRSRGDRLRDILASLPDGHRFYDALVDALHEARVVEGEEMMDRMSDYQDVDR